MEMMEMQRRREMEVWSGRGFGEDEVEIARGPVSWGRVEVKWMRRTGVDTWS